MSGTQSQDEASVEESSGSKHFKNFHREYDEIKDHIDATPMKYREAKLFFKDNKTRLMNSLKCEIIKELHQVRFWRLFDARDEDAGVSKIHINQGLLYMMCKELTSIEPSEIDSSNNGSEHWVHHLQNIILVIPSAIVTPKIINFEENVTTDGDNSLVEGVNTKPSVDEGKSKSNEASGLDDITSLNDTLENYFGHAIFQDENGTLKSESYTRYNINGLNPEVESEEYDDVHLKQLENPSISAFGSDELLKMIKKVDKELVKSMKLKSYEDILDYFKIEFNQLIISRNTDRPHHLTLPSKSDLSYGFRNDLIKPITSLMIFSSSTDGLNKVFDMQNGYKYGYTSPLFENFTKNCQIEMQNNKGTVYSKLQKEPDSVTTYKRRPMFYQEDMLPSIIHSGPDESLKCSLETNTIFKKTFRNNIVHNILNFSKFGIITNF
ncbi:hypothetical protein BN7_2040 [Wickerhamomyces ciferrii]|uniref:Uncharacterized protein n=1 Tax=Wickerhamomyces ciferrii (strain ATCC 14091 / BCRC 22168 / CBS 111 / JCM 3599 / NBRC 0793 / NRRL Y-1031 F-60-10) TaxID=1206466 RepID=K0KBQ8_WICCF|nr:uncharacterized protein BN7_2040 [Wickerhamomyces ciferrii]CCH42495.1 hypothetical protein BN7_2040 [Wickerhamomyces ciferrii]